MKKLLLTEIIKKEPAFLTIEPYLRPQDSPIASHPQAREGRLVPLVVIDYGSLAARFKQVKYIGKRMVATMREAAKSAREIRLNPYMDKKMIERQTLAELEACAREWGVSEIGYTVVNPRYIFQGYRILYPNAMVFTIEMDREKIKQAPSVPAFIEIFRTYYQMGVIVNKVAAFLRERGYNAQAGPAIGGDVNYVPLAIDAGLGASGKNGMLITRNHGPRIRLAAVYTDIENLPLSQGNSHAWVSEYCQRCNICVKQCPAGAIYPQPKILTDGGPEFIDYKKCALPFSNDNGCTLCIKFCPFSNLGYEKVKIRFLGAGEEASERTQA